MNIRMRGPQMFISARRTRRQRRGLRAHGQPSGPGGDSNSKFQKVAAFHDVSLLVFERVMRRECECIEMNGG
jgi:hypothetical protein